MEEGDTDISDFEEEQSNKKQKTTENAEKKKSKKEIWILKKLRSKKCNLQGLSF